MDVLLSRFFGTQGVPPLGGAITLAKGKPRITVGDVLLLQSGFYLPSTESPQLRLNGQVSILPRSGPFGTIYHNNAMTEIFDVAVSPTQIVIVGQADTGVDNGIRYAGLVPKPNVSSFGIAVTGKPGVKFKSVTYSNGAYYALIQGSLDVMKSPDGVNWTVVATIASAPSVNFIRGSATELIIGCQNGSILRSVNGGVNWTVVASDLFVYFADGNAAFAPTGGYYIDGVWYVVDGQRGAITRSTDGGATWSYCNSNPMQNGDYGIVGMAKLGNRIVAVGGLVARYSDDGLNFTVATNPLIAVATNPVKQMVTHDGFFVAICGTGADQLYGSRDGQAWFKLPWSSMSFISGNRNVMFNVQDYLGVVSNGSIWYGDQMHVGMATSNVSQTTHYLRVK